MKSSSSSFEYLPGEVIDAILSFCSFTELLNLSGTCRRLCFYAYKPLATNLAFYHCYFYQIPLLESSLIPDTLSWPAFRTPSVHIQPKSVDPEMLDPPSVNSEASIPYGTLQVNKLESWLSATHQLLFFPPNVKSLDFTPHQQVTEDEFSVTNTVGFQIANKIIDPLVLANLREITLRIEFDKAFESDKKMLPEYLNFYSIFFSCLNISISRYPLHQIQIRILFCCPLLLPYNITSYVTDVSWNTTEAVLDMVGILWLASKFRCLKTLLVAGGGASINSIWLPSDKYEVILHLLPFTLGTLEYLTTFYYMLPLQLETSWLPKSLLHLGLLNFPKFLTVNCPIIEEYFFNRLFIEIRQSEFFRDVCSVPFTTLTHLEISSPLFFRLNSDISDLVYCLVGVNNNLEHIQIPSLNCEALAFVITNSPRLKVLIVLLEIDECSINAREEKPDAEIQFNFISLTGIFNLLSKCSNLETVFLPTFTGQITAEDFFEVVQECPNLKSMIFHQIHEFDTFPFEFEKYENVDSRVGCFKELDPHTRNYVEGPATYKGKRRKKFLFHDEPPIRKSFIEERATDLFGGRYDFYYSHGCFPEDYCEEYRLLESFIPFSSNQDAARREMDYSNYNTVQSDTDIMVGESESLLKTVTKNLTGDSQNENSFAVLYEKPSTKVPNYNREYYPWPHIFWFRDVAYCKESFFSSAPSLRNIPYISESQLGDIVFDRFIDPNCHNNVLIADISKLKTAAAEYNLQRSKEERKIQQQRKTHLEALARSRQNVDEKMPTRARRKLKKRVIRK